MEDSWRVVAPASPTIYPGDVHPNAALHAEYARRLDAFLGELGWLEQARRAWSAANAGGAARRRALAPGPGDHASP
jgi:hypothetical protein